MLTPNPALPEGHPGVSGERFFTIQRVNGNGANGRNEGVGGGHRHTLEDSDRVKKNSVQRHVLNEARDRRKPSQVRTFIHSFWFPFFPTTPWKVDPTFVDSYKASYRPQHICTIKSYSHFVYIHLHNQTSKWWNSPFTSFPFPASLFDFNAISLSFLVLLFFFLPQLNSF